MPSLRLHVDTSAIIPIASRAFPRISNALVPTQTHSPIASHSLVLTPWNTQMTPLMVRHFSDPRTVAYLKNMPQPFTLKDAYRLAASLEGKIHYAVAAIESEVQPDHVVVCNVIGSLVVGMNDCGMTELGYYLEASCWGRGIMGSCVRAITESCGLQEKIYVHYGEHVAKIYAFVHVENVASARLLESCGFVREVVLKKNRWVAGQGFVDEVLFAFYF
ncbi:hypothetical protein HDU80_001891 [Chytriomyces hyalinus]|nr:hypothetical protein HDU80_001891 [Chytriomyces hyalinus]